ncbi:MAG: pyrrolo-quinoline quinone, partial [Gammaproteobacteria bacterium]
NGYFDAFAADRGELLWRYKAEHGVNAPPITYKVNGRQYIAVGAGGNSIFNYPVGDELLVFSLGE